MNLHWVENGHEHFLVSKRENIGVSYRQMRTAYVHTVSGRVVGKCYTLQDVCDFLNDSYLGNRFPQNEGETGRKWYNRLLWELG